MSLKPTIRSLANETFNIEIENVKIKDNANKITEDVNKWISSKTNNRIAKLLDDPLGEDTKMVLLNSIYFKGLWQSPFDSKQTRKDDFFNEGQEAKKSSVDFMRNEQDFRYEVDEDGDSWLELPYASANKTMEHSLALIIVSQSSRINLNRN